MKIIVSFKDPDAVSNAIKEAARRQLSEVNGISDEEREMLEETRREQISDVLGAWFEYGEYCHVEIDLDTRAARVLPVHE